MEDGALDDLVRRMAGLVARLDMHYEKLTEFIEEQRNTNRELHEFNKQQVALNTTVSATLARLEAFISRTENNGR